MPMEKTNRSHCRRCVYGMDYGGQTAVYCDYLGKTGKLRNFEIGWCDKFLQKKRKRLAEEGQDK